jgi:hypothetical protein
MSSAPLLAEDILDDAPSLLRAVRAAKPDRQLPLRITHDDRILVPLPDGDLRDLIAPR